MCHTFTVFSFVLSSLVFYLSINCRQTLANLEAVYLMFVVLFVAGDKQWLAHHVGLKYIWTVHFSGWTRCLHKWDRPDYPVPPCHRCRSNQMLLLLEQGREKTFPSILSVNGTVILTVRNYLTRRMDATGIYFYEMSREHTHEGRACNLLCSGKLIPVIVCQNRTNCCRETGIHVVLFLKHLIQVDASQIFPSMDPGDGTVKPQWITRLTKSTARWIQDAVTLVLFH